MSLSFTTGYIIGPVTRCARWVRVGLVVLWPEEEDKDGGGVRIVGIIMVRYGRKSYMQRNRKIKEKKYRRRSYSRCPTPVTGPLPPSSVLYTHSVITVHAIKSPERAAQSALRCGVVMAVAADRHRQRRWSFVSFVPRRVYSLHTPPGPPRIRCRWKTLTRSVAHSVSDL